MSEIEMNAEMNWWILVYETNEMKVTKQICNIPLLKYNK